MATKKEKAKKWVDKKEKEEETRETEEKGKEIEKEEDDIYDKEEREGQLEEDEISPAEAGFVEGYEDEDIVECGACGGQIDWEKAVEREINGKTYMFCNKKCAESFEKRKARD